MKKEGGGLLETKDRLNGENLTGAHTWHTLTHTRTHLRVHIHVHDTQTHALICTHTLATCLLVTNTLTYFLSLSHTPGLSSSMSPLSRPRKSERLHQECHTLWRRLRHLWKENEAKNKRNEKQFDRPHSNEKKSTLARRQRRNLMQRTIQWNKFRIFHLFSHFRVPENSLKFFCNETLVGSHQIWKGLKEIDSAEKGGTHQILSLLVVINVSVSVSASVSV